MCLPSESTRCGTDLHRSRELIPKGLEKGDLPYPLKMGRALISSEVAGGGKNRIPVVPEELDGSVQSEAQ